MPVIAEDVIRTLAGFRAEQAPVTSCYLDVDGRRLVRHQDVEHEVDLLLRSARDTVGRDKGNGHASVESDLRRIEDFIKGGFDRSRTRGLAIFACSAHDLWEVIPLPVPVRNRVVINRVPAVSQLEAVLEGSEAMAVLLADAQRARVFVFELGELTEQSELLDELPRDVDTRGAHDQGDTAKHVAAHKLQHLRRAAGTAWQVYQERGFDHLAIAAPDEIAKEIEALLHPYLRERLCGRISVPVSASLEEIRAAAIDMEARVERRREAAEVARLRDAVAIGRRGLAGLGPVLDALNERRVDRLLVSQSYVESGWHCDGCGRLSLIGRRCKGCGAEMVEVADIVEEAIEAALTQGCRVEICVANADLDVLGRVGALLRY